MGRRVAAAVCHLAILWAMVMSPDQSFAREEKVEVRAMRACAGIKQAGAQLRGRVRVDNLTIQGDGSGNVTIKRDGVDLGHFEKGTYENYKDCLIQVIKLISPRPQDRWEYSEPITASPMASALRGRWRGEIFQPGGPHYAYILEMQLGHSGERVFGSSRFTVIGSAERWAEADINGTTSVVRATLGRQGDPPVRNGYWCQNVRITFDLQSPSRLAIRGDPDSGCKPWDGTLQKISN